MPDVGNLNVLHIDRYLTTFSAAYTNEDYVHEVVFPQVPVDIRSNKWPIYNRDTFLRSSGLDAQGNSKSIRRPRTRSTEISWDLSQGSYYAEQRAKNYLLTDAEVRLADDPLSPAIDSTMSLMETIFLDLEVMVASKTCKRGNYASANQAQLTAASGNGTSWAKNGTPYSTTQYSFPISVDIPNGQKAVMTSGLRAPNKMLLNFASATTLAANWEYRDAFKGVSTEAMTRSGLVPVVKGLEIVEARAQQATNAEGTPSTTDYVWKDDQSPAQNIALIYYSNPQVTGLRTLTYGLQFDAPDDQSQGHGVVTERWREQWYGGDRIEVRVTRDNAFTATDGSTSGDKSSGFASLGYVISGTDL